MKNKCAVSKTVCVTQTDPAGVPCIYHSNNGTCIKDPSTPIPNIENSFHLNMEEFGHTHYQVFKVNSLSTVFQEMFKLFSQDLMCQLLISLKHQVE